MNPFEHTENGITYLCYDFVNEGERYKDGLAIESVTPDNITSLVIPDKINGKEVVAISNDCFHSYERLQSISLPRFLKTIRNLAFFNCSSLEVVKFNSEQITFGYKAFSRCTALKTFMVPEGTEDLGAVMFSECRNLQTVVLPQGLKKIGDGCFASCFALKNINLPQSLTSIGEMCFIGCSSLTEVTIPDNVTCIGQQAFELCDGLKAITLPKRSRTANLFDPACFNKCSKLRQFYIPYGVETLPAYMFDGCTSLENVSIPESVHFIEARCFASCTSLKKVELPVVLQHLESEVFDGCPSLKEIVMPDNIRKWRTGGHDARFNNAEVVTLRFRSGRPPLLSIPASMLSAYIQADTLVEMDLPNGVHVVGGIGFTISSRIYSEDKGKEWWIASLNGKNTGPMRDYEIAVKEILENS